MDINIKRWRLPVRKKALPKWDVKKKFDTIAPDATEIANAAVNNRNARMYSQQWWKNSRTYPLVKAACSIRHLFGKGKVWSEKVKCFNVHLCDVHDDVIETKKDHAIHLEFRGKNFVGDNKLWAGSWLMPTWNWWLTSGCGLVGSLRCDVSNLNKLFVAVVPPEAQ